MSKRLEMLETMIAKGSNDPFVHYARALELRSVGRTEDALAALEGVARSHPSYVPTYLIAGQLATELGRREDARELLSRGLDAAAAAGDAKARGELAAALDELEPI
ncbi:MAG: tetratricopeptide repeat protein [Polyangiaceae bacterium]|nr:tetratricopeptide repeat protein [Polyangiaceae bacterium]